jgi:hypothetical protein
VGTPDQHQAEQQSDSTGFEQQEEQQGQQGPSAGQAEEPQGDEEIKTPVAAGTPAMTHDIDDAEE